MPSPTPRRRPVKNGGRILVVGVCMLIAMIAVSVRLFVLQIQRHDGFADVARRQYESRVALQADRGPIYDRNGNLLVSTIAGSSFAVDPNSVQNAADIAARFHDMFGGKYADYMSKATMKNTSFVWLKRKIAFTEADSLQNLRDNGLIRVKEPLRHAEYSEVGAQVIGCTDVDNNGIAGVELMYNSALKGADGFMVMQRDARGRRRPDVDLPQTKPEDGNGLMLTIDIATQQIVEDELNRGVTETAATSGTAIAMDPSTGEIIAMAAFPGYDPNNPSAAEASAMRVRAITDMFEPGSTMKVITAAAALEEKKVALDEVINCENGIWTIGDRTIRDDHVAATMTMRQAFELSSNIAFAKIATRLSSAVFYKYARDFGFGIATGIDLPGEVNGSIKLPNQIDEATRQYMAFGYQLAVTPLQLLSAYAAIANGGVMMKPHLLKRRIDKDGTVLEEIQPVQVRRVVSAETAAQVRDLMVGVVEHGTGTQAAIEGMRVAGKTGTTQQLSDGAYTDKKHNASFVGFFPAERPRLVLLILLDAPTNGYYGGQVAAPIFRRIAERVTNMGTQGTKSVVAAKSVPVESSDRSRTRVPDLRGLDVASARVVAGRYNLKVAAQGAGAVVTEQSPAPGAISDRHMIVSLVTQSAATNRIMPDVRGLSIRRAMSLLRSRGAQVHVVGSGTVGSQSPPAGSKLGARPDVTLDCRINSPAPESISAGSRS